MGSFHKLSIFQLQSPLTVSISAFFFLFSTVYMPSVQVCLFSKCTLVLSVLASTWSDISQREVQVALNTLVGYLPRPWQVIQSSEEIVSKQMIFFLLFKITFVSCFTEWTGFYECVLQIWPNYRNGRLRPFTNQFVSPSIQSDEPSYRDWFSILSKKKNLPWITTGILLHPIPKSVNHLMTARAQNNIFIVHKQQDPCIKQHFSKGLLW